MCNSRISETTDPLIRIEDFLRNRLQRYKENPDWQKIISEGGGRERTRAPAVRAPSGWLYLTAITPGRLWRWQVCRGSSRIRGIHGGTLLLRRSCCRCSTGGSPTRRAFFFWPFSFARICVLDVAYYYFFNLFISVSSVRPSGGRSRRRGAGGCCRRGT